MRLHIVGLPHTQATAEHEHCGFTSKVRNLAQLPNAILYAGDVNDTPAELVKCFTRAQQTKTFGQMDWWRRGEFYRMPWDDPSMFEAFNRRVIKEIRARVEPHDAILLPTGLPMRAIIDAFPQHLCVEAGIGYKGIYAPYRVWESYAWMHATHGQNAVASCFDDVIYPTFDEHPAAEPGGYFLFAGRMTPDKGYEIAINASRALGAELVVLGSGGDQPKGPIYTGRVTNAARARLMAEARALFSPTQYLEPFGWVVGEALMTGCPVISTDFGAFTETVEHGVDGYRCRTMSDFITAAQSVGALDRTVIQDRARRRYSREAFAANYDRYFNRLQAVFGAGFYA